MLAAFLSLQDARKGVLFDDFPPVLQLQLKRFEYDFQRDTMVKVRSAAHGSRQRCGRRKGGESGLTITQERREPWQPRVVEWPHCLQGTWVVYRALSGSVSSLVVGSADIPNSAMCHVVLCCAADQ